MPQNDVAKMKVADLKRELKLRGLVTTGNKTDLQDRLQTALLDGDLSLEDTNISGEDLDEDAVLTDEDEAKILDENELLKSPSNELLSGSPPPIPGLSTAVSAPSAKKIVLKRQASITTNMLGTAKENAAPTPPKVHKPITMDSEETKKSDPVNGPKKVSELTLQERLELRAKKFGISTDSATSGNKIILSTEDPQLETLKKRAERFGVVVSSKMAKINDDEKLLKRQERFGTVKTSANTGTDVWAEKARLRADRFKITGPSTTTKVAITSTKE